MTDDDDDFDEESIPGFSHPEVAQTPRLPDKGKGRASEHDQPVLPSAIGGTTNAALAGNIGSSQNSGPRTTTQTIGGVRVETRYAYQMTYLFGTQIKLESVIPVWTRWTSLSQQRLLVVLQPLQLTMTYLTDP